MTRRNVSGLRFAGTLRLCRRSLGAIRAFAPLARKIDATQPTTGYEDVKRIAISRVLADNVESIQVDWALYGPKLAQVALTFGADDIDSVAADDDESQGAAVHRSKTSAGAFGPPASSPSNGTAASNGATSMPIRLGAVSYLNTRPLVYGLEARRCRESVPACDSTCPRNARSCSTPMTIDLGLIPSIEYPGHDYRIVPGVSIASDGPVASVAIFSKVPTENIRSIALDTSSRTSIALLRVLCARWFEIEPRLVSMPPDLGRMIGECDAALVIGDNALFTDEQVLGLEKVDLGEEWIGMTGLPFVYAFWAGRPGIVGPADVAALQEARDRGLAATAQLAGSRFPTARRRPPAPTSTFVRM